MSTAGVSGLAGRYAAALFELSEERGELDAVAEDLDGIRRMLRVSADLRRLAASPVVSREDQSKAVAAVMERAGVAALTASFVGVVARNRRLAALDEICEAFGELLAARRGERTAEVTTAHPLTDAQREALARQLRGMTGTGVAIDERVDASLLGGMVVKIGSRMVDSSLRTKLQRLELSLKGAA